MADMRFKIKDKVKCINYPDKETPPIGCIGIVKRVVPNNKCPYDVELNGGGIWLFEEGELEIFPIVGQQLLLFEL